MKRFNVLDRSLKIHQHYLLEASAGTGKTFSIQNIVVRLLMEPQEGDEPFSLQKILVVTFTRAAARDLRVRIRSTIEQCVHYLQSWLHSRQVSDEAPDYLRACMEEGSEAVKLARKRLQHALFTFDQAQIFTIHGFCARMLKQFAIESDFGFHAISGEEPLPQSEVIGVVRDFFRTEIRLEHYSPAQIDILLKGDRHQKKLIALINSGHGFAQFPPLDAVLSQFKAIMQTLKERFALTSEKLIEDFQAQASAYSNYKKDVTKAKTLECVIRFAGLFDCSEWTLQELDLLINDGLVWVQALDPSLLKNRKSIPALHYPELTQELKVSLYPLIEQASDFPVLLARMAGDCQRHLRRYQNEEERLSPDDVLRKMHAALDQTDFTSQIQANFQAAIIDEFQDTDPLQWQIFQRLFLPETLIWKGFLYLVGDPKQSIYSFRQADIYTYLAAAKALGNRHCYSLDVNYRSQPPLVDALNHLFAAEHLPCFIPLPKQLTHLPYHPVQSTEKNRDDTFDDVYGAVHFCIGDGTISQNGKLEDLEDQIFFPFIAKEIIRLRNEKRLAYRQFAVLVRDRHQASRLAEFLNSNKIPTINQRGASLADSSALQALIELMRAVMHPHDRGALRTALGSQLLGWTQEDLKADDAMEFGLVLIQQLRSCLFEKGFSSFFQDMLQIACKPCGATVVENLLSRETGLEFYRDLQQIGDIVIDNQYQEWNGFEGIIPFLDQFKLWDENDDERLKRYQDPGADGVKILTLHFSKGLEFDIVFALGLAKRPKASEELFPVENEGKIILTPLDQESDEYRHHYEEVDAEKMRQLYVALTRAKYRLYIPIALHLPSENLAYGRASPNELFLARFLQPAVEYDVLYERIRQANGEHLIDFIERTGKEHSITYSLHREKIDDIPSEIVEEETLELHEPLHVSVHGDPLWVTSFTTLSRQSGHGSSSEVLKLASAPKDYQAESKTAHTLPANSETGLLVHSIMENLNYRDFLPLKTVDEALSLIIPHMQNVNYREWDYAVASLIFNTLKVPLKPVAENFCLAQVDPAGQFREMPFLFPMQKGENIEELASQEGLIKGVIDYLFVHDGVYYLVDWKSNWLGHRYENYDAVSMRAAMEDNSYFLQAEIYTEALKRYLKLVEPRSFKECFGGVFYLFLRGMQPNEATGIYHFFPENF